MSEQTEHEALADFLLRMEGRYPALAFVKHCPNEADGGGQKVKLPYTRRDGTQGWKTVPLETLRGAARGIKPGVWDWEFLAPNMQPIFGFNTCHFQGIAVELKVGDNKLSPAQAQWEAHYRANNWYTAVAYQWTFAARLLVLWVGGRPEEIQGL